ncbi:unnamed protein product, partial [marine sediment metagenome]
RLSTRLQREDAAARMGKRIVGPAGPIEAARRQHRATKLPMPLAAGGSEDV